jgi:hypothetical protein
MKSLKKWVFGIGVGLLMMIAAIALQQVGKSVWLHWSGAVIANGVRAHGYTDKPFRILSVSGQRWSKWEHLERASAYHALVVLPETVPDGSARLSLAEGFTHTVIERWQPSKGSFGNSSPDERELAVKYDAVWQTVTIDSHAYDLAHGNLVCYSSDSTWKCTDRCFEKYFVRGR